MVRTVKILLCIKIDYEKCDWSITAPAGEHNCSCWGASLQLLVSITAAAGEHQCRSCGLIVAYWAAPEKGTLFSMEDSASSWVLNKVTERVQYLHTINVNITFLSQDQSSPESTIYTSILYMYIYISICHLHYAIPFPQRFPSTAVDSFVKENHTLSSVGDFTYTVHTIPSSWNIIVKVIICIL